MARTSQSLRNHDEANVSAEQSTPRQDPRLPFTYEYEGRSVCACRAAEQGPRPPLRIVSTIVLARPMRVRLQSEFVRVTRTGRKARSGCVVVYRLCVDPLADQEGLPGPSRGGLVVGRSVGNAVTRHRVSRVLRAELAELLPRGGSELVVVRALPGAGSAGASQLRQDLGGALGRLRQRSADQNKGPYEPSACDLGQGSGTDTGVSP